MTILIKEMGLSYMIFSPFTIQAQRSNFVLANWLIGSCFLLNVSRFYHHLPKQASDKMKSFESCILSHYNVHLRYLANDVYVKCKIIMLIVFT